MIVRIEVTKNKDESASNLMRRFNKRIRGSGVLKHIRKNRFKQRPMSPFVKKKRTLNRIAKQKKIEQLRKDGKIKDVFAPKHY